MEIGGDGGKGCFAAEGVKEERLTTGRSAESDRGARWQQELTRTDFVLLCSIPTR